MSHFEYRMVPLGEQEHTGDALDGRPEGVIREMAEHANALARAGWEYVRTDTVRTHRRAFLRRIEDTTSVLVFRRKFRVEPMPGLEASAPEPVHDNRAGFTGPILAFSQPQPAS